MMKEIDFKKWVDDCRINRIELYLHDYCEVHGHIIRMYKVVPERDDSRSISRFCVWVDNDMYIYDTALSSQRAFMLFVTGLQRGLRYEK